jgi:hypothetical protein
LEDKNDENSPNLVTLENVAFVLRMIWLVQEPVAGSPSEILEITILRGETRDRCHDFLIFSPKNFAEKIGVFDSKQS